MIISVPDCVHCSRFGLTKLFWLASSAPASPATPPAIAKQISL